VTGSGRGRGRSTLALTQPLALNRSDIVGAVAFSRGRRLVPHSDCLSDVTAPSSLPRISECVASVEEKSYCPSPPAVCSSIEKLTNGGADVFLNRLLGHQA